MPGTIQVSVLYLMDLPSPSSSITRETNLVSVKVFMGKREYQTWGKEDFSFPLMSLREKLIVALYDFEGKEIARKDFETKSVVEKGFWDESFSIEGGGRIIVKFQFILNEEERKRIRDVRESALKKRKDVGLLRNRVPRSKSVGDLQERVAQTKAVKFSDEPVEHSDPNPVWHRNATQSGPQSREDSPIERLDQTAPDGRGTPSTTPLLEETEKHPEHLPEYDHSRLSVSPFVSVLNDADGTGTSSTAPLLEETEKHPEHVPEYDHSRLSVTPFVIILNDTDGRGTPSTASLLEEAQKDPEHLPDCNAVDLTEANYDGSEKTFETQTPLADSPPRQISSQEALDPQFVCVESIHSDKTNESGSSVSLFPEEDKTHTHGTETAPKKVPSSVRKMISAFETDLPQGRIARVHPTTKSLSSKIEMDGSLKKTSVEDLGTMTNKAILKVAEKPKETIRPNNSYLAAGPESMRKDIKLLDFKNQNFKESNPRLHRHVELMDHKFLSKESLNVEGTTNVLKPIETEETVLLVRSAENAPEYQDSLFGVHCNTSTHEGYKTFEEKIILDELQEGILNERKEDPVGLVIQTADGSSDGTSLSQLSERFEFLAAKGNLAKHISSNDERMDKQYKVCGHVEDDNKQQGQDISFDVVHKKPTRIVEGDYSEDLTEAAGISGEMLDEPAGTGQPCSLCTVRREPSVNEHLEGSGWRTFRDDSDDPSACGASNDKQKLEIYSEVECFPFVNTCSWILPNEARRLCITTASKPLRNLIEGCGIYIETHLSEITLSSMEATEEHNMCDDASIAVDKDDEVSCNLRQAKVNSSTDVSKIIGGLIEQAMKVTIVIAFGALVLTTRQRKTR